MWRVLKWLGIGAAIILFAAVAGFLTCGVLFDLKPEAHVPSGLPQQYALYLTMKDGTRIAADVYLPKDLKAGEKVPALIVGTPYWRGAELSFLGKAFAELGLLHFGDPSIAMLNARGYAVVAVDARGTGASFGHVNVMFDDQEVGDYGTVIDWIARQGWSNGNVGAYGFSYRGVTAVNMAALGHPALKAIAPTFDFPDLYITGHPGGVFSDSFLNSWGALTGELNRGRPPCTGLCAWMFAGPEPVDADTDGALLAQAIAEHAKNYAIYPCAKAAPYRDDKICSSGKSFNDVSEIARQDAIQKSAVPMHIVVGWLDSSSAAQALKRFSMFSNPQELIVGPLNHGGTLNTDPYTRTHRPDPLYSDQIDDIADFFDRYLKHAGKRPITKSIRYFEMGEEKWRYATSWPPAGVKAVDWYLAPAHLLAAAAPNDGGADNYKVDFSASSGATSRYQSPVSDETLTSYPDRAAQDAKLLTYTSAPLDADIDLAGNPVARLTLASDATDGEVIVYLEDVWPNGRIVYLSEGVLRLADRKIAGDLAAAGSTDAFHTYLKADSAPMTPGKAEPIEIELLPISVQIAKGHRIRVAIAGADKDNLERIPASGDPTFTVAHGSSVELPEIGD